MKWWLVLWGWSCVVMSQELLLQPMELTPEVRAEIQASFPTKVTPETIESVQWDRLSTPALQSIFDQAMMLVSQAGGDGLPLMVEADNPAIASLLATVQSGGDRLDSLVEAAVYAGVPDSQLQAMGLKDTQDSSFKSFIPDSVWESLRNVGILSD